MIPRRYAGAVLAALTLGVCAAAARGQSAPQVPEFTDWISTDGQTTTTGTLLGHSVVFTGTNVGPAYGTVTDGTATIFDSPNFTPRLARSDNAYFNSFDGFSYRIVFGAPVKDPVLHLHSFGSRLDFTDAPQITRVSGDADFRVSGSAVTGVAGGPDSNGTIRLSGTFQSVPFTTTYSSTQPDGINIQIGGTAPPAATPTPTPTATSTPTGPTLPKLPPGLLSPDLPPISGVRVVTEPLSGEVTVTLPSGGGPIPLSSAASIPVGAVVDARKGSLSLTAAADASGRPQSATLSAGIFKIRQARALKGAATPTSFVLTTPPGDARACATKRLSAKGVVRTLSLTAKGVFRTVGAKSVTTGRNASWITSDRCDGTLTKVRRGRVAVKAGRRTVRLGAGRTYLAKARLFGAKRRR